MNEVQMSRDLGRVAYLTFFISLIVIVVVVVAFVIVIVTVTVSIDKGPKTYLRRI
jgi:hypothetical protein